jgi:hypothetical protein
MSHASVVAISPETVFSRKKGAYLDSIQVWDSLVGKMTLAITNGDWLVLNVLYTSLIAFWT